MLKTLDWQIYRPWGLAAAELAWVGREDPPRPLTHQSLPYVFFPEGVCVMQPTGYSSPVLRRSSGLAPSSWSLGVSSASRVLLKVYSLLGTSVEHFRVSEVRSWLPTELVWV